MLDTAVILRDYLKVSGFKGDDKELVISNEMGNCTTFCTLEKSTLSGLILL